MLKISFTNAEVSDHGYGLEVNGKSLEDIISTALGTKVKGNGGYGSGLPSFSSNSCDVRITEDELVMLSNRYNEYVESTPDEGFITWLLKRGL